MDLLGLLAPDLERNVQKIARDTGVEVQLLRAISQAVAAGIVAGNGAAAGSGAISGLSPTAARVISMPLMAESINEAIIAARLPATDVYLYSNSFVLPVAPSATLIHSFGTGGLPTTTIGPLTVDASQHALIDGTLDLQVTVDGTRNIIGPPELPDYTIFERGQATFGQNLVIRNVLTVSLTSLLTDYAGVNFTGNFLRMSQGFYRNVYQPLITQYGLPEVQTLLKRAPT